MKKVILLVFVSILLLFAFTSCAKITALKNKLFGKNCEHEWTEATCQSPKTCNLCGIQDGSVGPHKTVPATCTEPQKCSLCGFTSDYWGAALGHDWREASCFSGTAKTCKTCGIVDGDVPDHEWSEATCDAASKCGVCGLSGDGNNGGSAALGHDFVDTAEGPATCTTDGSKEGVKCSRCPVVQSGCEKIPALNHKGFEVEIPGTPATCTESGLTPGSQCSKCGVITDAQLVIDPKGHQRYTYDDDGEILTDGFIKTEYPVNPVTGLPYAACESDGITTYTCQLCNTAIETPEAKIAHKYPENATCTDVDAQCIYCDKNIEHEFLDPTCTDAATCRICHEVDNDRPALNHNYADGSGSAMIPANCLSPATCAICGHIEGEKLVHKLTVTAAAGRLTYSCTDCGTTFSPLSESFYLDGSTYDNMVPVNNKFGGYETAVDSSGNANQYPAIKEDANGNKYYSLIKTKDPETDANGTAYPPQVQLWIPMQRGGFSGFTSANTAVGFLSFRINACMDKNFSLTFVEGAAWSEEDVIRDFFVITPPTADDAGNTTVKFLGLDDGNADTPALVLFEKDVTGATSIQDKYTGWHDVYIGIVLDDTTDTINLHYYIDGMYRGSITAPLTTIGNGIKCIYVSGNTNENGSGVMLDDIGFGYTINGSYGFDLEHEHLYNIVHEEVLPTCTNDGYRIYACDCGSVGTREAIPNLGHLAHVEPELLPTCTEGGYSSYSYCVREGCGMDISLREYYPANGHTYNTTVDREATCTRQGALMQNCTVCGYVNQVVRPALGHDYPLTNDCNYGGTCTRCSASTQLPIGHAYADATCTDPKTCMRAGCGATEGEPLGHDMAAATCTVAPTCTRCQHIEGETIPHTLQVKYVKSVITYVCTECNTSFQFKNGYTLTGANTNNMVGTGNSGGYTVTAGTQLPAIVDGHYEFIHTKTSNSDTQIQLWVPVADNSADFGFSSENRAVGVLSFKMNVYMTQNLDLKLVDGNSNSGANRWKAGAVAGNISISTVTNGKVTFTLSTMNGGNYVNNHVIADVAVGSDNFTGWIDIVIGIVLDPDTDQITYHCYTNGEYVVSFSSELTTLTNSINAIYISGNTASEGSGFMFDDLAFGYTANGTWVFDECRHEGTPVVTAPTCTSDGYTKTVCDKCGHISITDVISATGHTEAKAPDCDHGSLCANCGEYYGDALGHTGGKATCEKKPVCDRCGEEYGVPAHDIVGATCDAGSYCKICNTVFGEKVSHKPRAILKDEIVTYMCEYCEKSYVLEKVYYQDGDTSIGGAVTVVEDPSYELDTSNGNYKYTLLSSAQKNGKAWVWLPTNGSGITDFEGFKNGAVGVLSFTLDVYTSQSFQVHLIDSDNRSNGSFWNNYTMQGIFSVGAPVNNVVSIKGWNNEELRTVTVTDDNQYTGEFDVTIGIEISGGKITFHYYLDGQYVASVTDTFKITSGKIDGVAFLCESKVKDSGYTLDNVVFGYAVPYSENLAPVKPKD